MLCTDACPHGKYKLTINNNVHCVESCIDYGYLV